MAERFQKGHQQSIGDGYKHQMEQRCYSRPPEMTEAPVCTRSEKCEGCPFPATGFICWGTDGDCMRTRFDRLKEVTPDESIPK